MIMAENSRGDMQPLDPQVAYFDGYGIEERLLEGVKFKVERVPLGRAFQLVCNGVHESHQDYMRKFSKSQMRTWCAEVVRQIEDGMEMTNLEGTEDYYWDASADGPPPEKPKVTPKRIGKVAARDVMAEVLGRKN